MRHLVLMLILASGSAAANVASQSHRSQVAGIDLITYHTEVKDVVVILGSLPAGDAMAEPGNIAVPTLTGMMLDRGTKTLDKYAIAEQLDNVGAEIAFSTRARRQLIAEIIAQFEAFAATGLALDHCNAHKHFHLHPTIGRIMAFIGQRFGVRAVRVPAEPLSVLREVEPSTTRAPSLLTAPLAGLLKRQLRAAGLDYPDRVFGLRWSGAMTQARLAGLLRQLPEGLTEIYLHPATGAYAGSAPGYRYRDEMEALTAPDIVKAGRGGTVRLGGFVDFVGPAAAGSPAARSPAATSPATGGSHPPLRSEANQQSL